jgi:putative ABC transport system permease protein
VTVLPVKGARQPIEMRVAEISNSYIGLAVYCDIDYLSRCVGEELALSGVQLLADPRPVSRRALYRELKRLPGLRSVNLRAEVIANIRVVIRAQRIFISLLVVFAGVIFFCGLLNASLISLAERRREVATLRVLGYGPWQVGGMFLRESLITNGVGTLVGMPLGYALSGIIAIMYNTDLFRFPLVAPPVVWLTTTGLSVAFALSAHGFVQRSVHRLDWLEASKTRE